VFWLLCKFSEKNSHSKNHSKTNYHKRTKVFMPSTLILMRFQLNILNSFNSFFFEKSSNIKFYENRSSGSRNISLLVKDITKLIVYFHNFAKLPKLLMFTLNSVRYLLIFTANYLLLPLRLRLYLLRNVNSTSP